MVVTSATHSIHASFIADPPIRVIGYLYIVVVAVLFIGEQAIDTPQLKQS